MLPAASPHLPPASLAALTAASSAPEIIGALAEICEGLGMHRFIALRTVGVHMTRVMQVLHNVPEREAGPLESGNFWSNCSELHGLLKGQPPFIYNAGDIGAPFIPAPGFTSGVAAACMGQRDACVLVMGCADAALKPDARALVRGYTLLTATYTSAPMSLLPSAACPLTDRELDCLRLSAMGLSSKEVGPLLGISWRTVDVFLARARTRLGVDTTFAATMAALDFGWITLDDANQATG